MYFEKKSRVEKIFFKFLNFFVFDTIYLCKQRNFDNSGSLVFSKNFCIFAEKRLTLFNN